MKCQNPECDKEAPENPSRDQRYCCPKCRNRANRIKDTARRRARRAAPIPVEFAPSKGHGIGPLRTSKIKAARKREQALIDKVVAKAQVGGGPENMYRTNKTSWHGVKVG